MRRLVRNQSSEIRPGTYSWIQVYGKAVWQHGIRVIEWVDAAFRQQRHRRRTPSSKMKNRAPNTALGSEFDRFLFAPIGDDRNGMTVSVVSLLGRMDLDPWEEAASLARFSVSAAVHRLASLLRALPDQSVLQSDPDSAATRLIALLPQPAETKGWLGNGRNPRED